MNIPLEAPPKFVDEKPHGKAVKLALQNPLKKKLINNSDGHEHRLNDTANRSFS
jgi:hypothetical protein